jgi:hypothetical protein
MIPSEWLGIPERINLFERTRQPSGGDEWSAAQSGDFGGLDPADGAWDGKG